MKTVCISGGFDPAHIGHLEYAEAAAKHGRVIAIVNSDAWLIRKKGYVFMPFEQRARLVGAWKCVDEVVAVDDIDGTVCEALQRIKPDYFAKSGDRTRDNTPEQALCTQLGIEMLWDVGGGKVESSSDLVRRCAAKLQIPCTYEHKK